VGVGEKVAEEDILAKNGRGKRVMDKNA